MPDDHDGRDTGRVLPFPFVGLRPRIGDGDPGTAAPPAVPPDPDAGELEFPAVTGSPLTPPPSVLLPPLAPSGDGETADGGDGQEEGEHLGARGAVTLSVLVAAAIAVAAARGTAAVATWAKARAEHHREVRRKAKGAGVRPAGRAGRVPSSLEFGRKASKAGPAGSRPGPGSRPSGGSRPRVPAALRAASASRTGAGTPKGKGTPKTGTGKAGTARPCATPGSPSRPKSTSKPGGPGRKTPGAKPGKDGATGGSGGSKPGRRKKPGGEQTGGKAATGGKQKAPRGAKGPKVRRPGRPGRDTSTQARTPKGAGVLGRKNSRKKAAPGQPGTAATPPGKKSTKGTKGPGKAKPPRPASLKVKARKKARKARAKAKTKARRWLRVCWKRMAATAKNRWKRHQAAAPPPPPGSAGPRTPPGSPGSGRRHRYGSPGPSPAGGPGPGPGAGGGPWAGRGRPAPPPGMATGYTITLERLDEPGDATRSWWEPEPPAPVLLPPSPPSPVPAREEEPLSMSQHTAAPAAAGSVPDGGSELTIYDLIEADADVAVEIGSRAEEARADAQAAEQLVARLEELMATIRDQKIPGSLARHAARLWEQATQVRSDAQVLACQLPAAAEAITAAGQAAARRHQPLADATRDAGHAAPAEATYHHG